MNHNSKTTEHLQRHEDAGARLLPYSGIVAARTALVTVLLTAGCASGNPRPAAVSDRDQYIVPVVDHHQHIMSERAIGPAPQSAPLIELPAGLRTVIDERNRAIASSAPGDLFTADAVILDPTNGVWLQGDEGVSEITGLYHSDARFFANGYSLGDSVAVITGVIRSGDYNEDELNFVMGLERNRLGAWQIASEAASLLPPRQLATPVTVDDVIAIMDAVGIRKAVVLSVAYWFGDPTDEWTDEYEKTRAENDWTAAQVAKYPRRLVAFCGIAALRDYAEVEVRRCANELRVSGIKMHLSNSKVNLHDPAHVARVRRIFEVANELGLAIVVHTRTHRTFGDYGRAEAEIFLKEILSGAPDITVQVAHFWGGGELSEGALEVFADAISSGDPRARNLYFDLAEVERYARGSEDVVAQQARRIGMDRLFYGSDMQVSPDLPPSTLGWSRIMKSIPLTREELADIADNVAPYLQRRE